MPIHPDIKTGITPLGTGVALSSDRGSTRSPVEDFIDELDAVSLNNKNARVQLEQIIYCLNRLEDKGTRAGEKFTKRISGDIWELRPGNNRNLFFGWNDNHFVLLHHFSKTTPKTPAREIAIVEKRMEKWLSRRWKE